MSIWITGKTVRQPEKIKLASGHLLELINKVLEMSRIENGSLVLTEERLDIERLLREVTEIIKSAVQQKNISCSFA